MASKGSGGGSGPAKKESKISRIGAGKELDSEEEFSDEETDDAKFRKAFDPKSKEYHGGQTAAVPLGGARVPESMGGAAAADWMSLPEVEREEVNPEIYGAEYVKIDKERNDLANLKKSIAAMGPPCGALMANIAHLQRATESKNEELVKKLADLITGEEKKRAAAVARVREESKKVLPPTSEYAVEIEACCVQALTLKGVQTQHTAFDNRIKLAGQKIFKQMTVMMHQLKDIKKKHTAAKKPIPSKTEAAPKRVPLSERPLPAGLVAAMAEADAARAAEAAAASSSTAAATTTASTTSTTTTTDSAAAATTTSTPSTST